ncbi:MAG: class I SAM-dependent methyltransferase [Phycisphaeraceae bacterium]
MNFARARYLFFRTLHGLVSRRHAFNYIYRTRGWRGESVSGAASSLQRTAAVREALPAILQKTRSRSLLDIPCGDCHWIRHVPLKLDRYIGGDIVTPLVEQNRHAWPGPDREFRVLDLVTDPLPQADLVFCRDCLIHLSLRDGRAALDNIRRSGSRYLLTTTFPGAANKPIITGQWRPIDLTRPPFNLPEPDQLISERHPDFPAKSLGLWHLADAPEPA